MHDIYKQKCLVKSIYLVLQIKHCKKVHSSIGFNRMILAIRVSWFGLSFLVSKKRIEPKFSLVSQGVVNAILKVNFHSVCLSAYLSMYISII